MRLKALIVGLAFVLAAGPGQAATLFSVDGEDRDATTPIGGGALDKGAAQTFEVTQTLTDVAFSFDMTCYDDCSGELRLISGRMSPEATIFQEVFDTGYTGWEGAQSTLSWLTLVPDTYTLIMTMTTGNGGWHGTRTPLITGSVMTAENGYLVLNNVDPNFVPRSGTTPYPYADAMLKFTVTGNVATAPVPLPASLPLLLAALAGLGLIRRRGRG